MKRVYKRVSAKRQAKFMNLLSKIETLGGLNWFYKYQGNTCNYYIHSMLGKPQKLAYYYFDGSEDPTTKKGFAAYILKDLL